MRWLQLLAVLVVVSVFACDSNSNDLLAPAAKGPLFSVGSDPVTGATIETDLDDYVPGQFVHLIGHGWAANETVHLLMTEDPETHGDVEQDVEADSAGAFSIHFYDVQEHDLGVTFTLTATGMTSGSKAVAVFTDASLGYSAGQSLTVQAGNSVSFTQTITAPPGSGAFSVTLQVAGTVPASWVSASPAPLSFSGGDSKSWSVTFSVPTGTAPGPYTAQIKGNPSISGVGVGPGTAVTLNVTAVSKATTTTTVTFEAGPYVYRGTAFTATALVTGGGLNDPVNVTYSGDCVNVTSANGCTATASYAGDGTHEGSSDSKSITIAPAQATAMAGSGSTTYDGNTHSPSACAVSGAYTVGLSCTNSPAFVGPDAGTTAITPVVSGASTNFNVALINGSYTIDQAPSVTTVSCPANVTYTGLALTPCSAVATGAGGLNQALTVLYTDNVNAGTATASASFAGDVNHTISSDSKNFTIDPAPSVTTVSCPANVTYTGLALTPCSAVATGAGGLNEALTVLYTNNVNAGTAMASASFAGDLNHTISSDSKNFTIDPAPSVTTVSCPANVTYTGLALTPCSATATGAGGLNEALTVLYTDNVNAGTATASASFAGDVNHTISSDSKNFTIDPAPSTTTVTCPASVTYTGSPQTPCSASVTGAGGLNQILPVSYTNNTIGTATASASYAGDGNHTGSSDTKTFAILYASTGMCLGSPGHAILQPINADGSSVFKKGSTVPVKFRVCDANGNSVGGAGVTTGWNWPVQYWKASGAGAIDEEVLSTTPDTQFRWDDTAKQWVFNLNTKNLIAGTTYGYKIYLNDGTSIDFKFGVK